MISEDGLTLTPAQVLRAEVLRCQGDASGVSGGEASWQRGLEPWGTPGSQHVMVGDTVENEGQ